MSLSDGMILYHGSYTRVESVDLGKCFEGKDFGKGFYLTSDEDQAIRFIATSLGKARDIGAVPSDQTFGYVSRFEFVSPPDPLASYEFASTDAAWLWFVSMNRRKSSAGELEGRLPASVFDADVVIGKVANDTTNPVIATYLNGLYGPIESDRAVRTAVDNLMPDKLKDQFCFKSEAAVACLEFKGAVRYDV